MYYNIIAQYILIWELERSKQNSVAYMYIAALDLYTTIDTVYTRGTILFCS